MSDHTKAKGSCLCGAVTVTANDISKKMGACHCSICRKWSAGPLLAVHCGADVSFQGEENIAVYNSSEWAERGFCKQCGSHLFYRLKQAGLYNIPASIFDDLKDVVLQHQYFIDEKPDYYKFENKTHDMTGAEIFEKYLPKN